MGENELKNGVGSVLNSNLGGDLGGIVAQNREGI